MKFIVTICLIFFLKFSVFAQLVAGDIAFLGMQTDNPDAFAFVTLVDVPPNTQISFTDNGWSGSALFTNENTMAWTSPAEIVPLGTVIVVRVDASGQSIGLLGGPGSINGVLSNLSVNGDQILAYTGTAENPNFIAAISNNIFLESCNTVGTGNTNYTCLPSPLINGIDAIAIPGEEPEAHNIFVDFNDFSGTADDIRAIILDSENWTYSNDPAEAGFDVWPDWAFSFVNPDPSEINFQTGFLSLTEGGESAQVNFSISPASFGSQSFTIALSGDITDADLESSPPMQSGIITVQVPSGSSIVSIDLSAIEDLIPEGVETGSLIISAVSSGLIIGEGDSLNIEITELNGLSVVSFSETNFNANEGDGTAMVTIDISPPLDAPASFDISVNQLNISLADYSLDPVPVNGIIAVMLDAGESSYSIEVTIIDDMEEEEVESLEFTIENLSEGLVLGANSSAVFSIVDNDGNQPVSGLYINEVMASNTNTIQDENGEFDDWIEIYNDQFLAQDLAGLFITDDQANPSKYLFPSGDESTVIQPGGFKLIWADNSSAQGALHTNFTLSASGEYVGLFNSTGEVISELTFPALGPNESYGSVSETDETMIIFGAGFTTPNASNVTSSILENPFEVKRAYPVPANQFLTIEIIPSYKKGTLHMFNTSGQLVIQKEIDPNAESILINTSELPAGNYLIRTGLGQKANYSKITIAH